MSRLEKISRGIEFNNDVQRFGKHSSVHATLQRCPIFEGLSASVLSEVSLFSSFDRVMRRRKIYTQGDKGEYVFVVNRGRVRVFRYTGNERRFTIAYRGAGELIGECALAPSRTYQATAVATDQVDLTSIPISSIEKLIEESSTFARRILHLVASRCHETEQRLERLFINTIESRIATFLLDAVAHHGIPESRGTMIGAKYTHQEIADYVGSTRETVTLVLGHLRRRGLILSDHRQLVVRNEKGLVKVADTSKS